MTIPLTDLPDRPEDMICFAVYAASHALTRAYQPMLKALGLTYPQYIALTVLWESDEQTVGAMGKRLGMDTNTLTPLLKRLEAAGHIERRRGTEDERRVFVTLTKKGRALKAEAPEITRCIIGATGLELAELDQLVTTLTRMQENLKGEATV